MRSWYNQDYFPLDRMVKCGSHGSFEPVAAHRAITRKSMHGRQSSAVVTLLSTAAGTQPTHISRPKDPASKKRKQVRWSALGILCE
jgi:hypothetical protein